MVTVKRSDPLISTLDVYRMTVLSNLQRLDSLFTKYRGRYRDIHITSQLIYSLDSFISDFPLFFVINLFVFNIGPYFLVRNIENICLVVFFVVNGKVVMETIPIICLN